MSDSLKKLGTMKILWAELKKIMRQAQAKENIFGYKSTEANQLFLLYCFAGKIFFTDKIHPRVKHLWFRIVAFQASVCYFVVISNLWSGSEKDLMALFDIMNLLGICNTIVLGYPLILYWFRTGIEAMIKGVDEICTLRSSSDWDECKNSINIKKVLLINVTCVCINFPMNFFYLCDVMLFFEKEKIDNRYYYPLSVPLVENFRSNGNYFIFNCLMIIIISLFTIQSAFVTYFIIYWGMTCHNALLSYANEINTAMDNLNSQVELTTTNFKNYNNAFNKVLISNIKRFQKITRIIDNFRGFFQLIGSAVIPASFFLAIAQLHVTISANLPLILRLKSLPTTLLCVWFVLMLYWTAEKLENSISELSLAVYSTPWYRSVKTRKIVSIFLHQTQKTKNLKIMKVYPLSLQNFWRYLHGVLTYTTTLRKLTHKC